MISYIIWIPEEIGPLKTIRFPARGGILDAAFPKDEGKSTISTQATGGLHMHTDNSLKALKSFDQSVWLDYLHRELLRSG